MAPSKSRIHELFHPLSIQGQQSKLFEHHVSDEVHWTILGHSPLSGVYTSKSEFVEKTLTFLAEKVMSEPLTLRVLNVVSDGDGNGDGGDWATVEMEAIDATCKNGETIVQVRAYLDTKLLTDAIQQNA